MKKILAALLVVAMLLLGSVVGLDALTEEQAVQIARAEGFPGEIYVVSSDDLNGGYATMECFMWMYCVEVEPYVILWQPDWAPDTWMKLILLHELAHGKQHAEGRLESMVSIDREWEADILSLEAAPKYGATQEDYRDMWLNQVRLYGNYCSDSHGCSLDRMMHTLRAVNSRLYPDTSGVQAP